MCIDNDSVPNKNKNKGTFYKTLKQIVQDKGVLISRTKSGHYVYRTFTPGTSRKEYHAVNHNTGKVDVSMDGMERLNVISKILLVANPGNTIKAHDFYHHLIQHHNKVLVNDMLSLGGKIVLKRLNTKYHATVQTHGWLDGKAQNLTDKDDEYVYGDCTAPEQSQACRMKLVSHKII